MYVSRFNTTKDLSTFQYLGNVYLKNPKVEIIIYEAIMIISLSNYL